MRGARWIVSLGITAMVASATGAVENHSSIAACGHLDELAAAKRALEQGDKATALIHLRNADALLSRCERDSERAAEPSEAEPADPSVVGEAGAPPSTAV